MSTYDTNGDGYADVYGSDADGDGYEETLTYDSNQDGYADGVATDTNLDGYVDIAGSDANQSGYYEVVTVDTDGDGYMETVLSDANENGVHDSAETGYVGGNNTPPFTVEGDTSTNVVVGGGGYTGTGNILVDEILSDSNDRIIDNILDVEDDDNDY